jgi:arsenite methyltransferase
MPQKKPDHLAEIDAFYRRRLAAPPPPGPGCCPALAADYAPAELAALPAGMAASSFGCGNPLAFAGVRPGETVVDLGCGAGLDLLLAAERVGPTGHVVGIDMSPDLLARARANADRAGATQVALHEGTIEALPLADASADWVISNCVVNLSMDKPAVFAEIARVLRPGGRVLISDLVAEDLPDWVHRHRDLYAACIAGAISQARYVDLARAAGLTDVHVVDRTTHDAGMIRVLVADDLPVALDALARRLGMGRDAARDHVAAELAGKVASIKLAARRPG